MAAKKGDIVRVDYTGTFENGEIFDTSTHGDHSHPLEFEAGAGQMIRGFDEAVVGMAVGEEKDITLTPQEAYGEYDPGLTQEIGKSELPEGANITVGEKLVAVNQHNEPIQVSIAAVGEDSVTIDFNHPLAGKTLKFKIRLVEINAKEGQ